MRLSGRTAAFVITAALLSVIVTPAQAELTQSGDLFVSFSGGIDPGALPRHALAPIAVRVAGRIRTLPGHRPPSLRRITIAINRGGRLDTHGLPVCPPERIAATSSEDALAACRSALVGGGSFAARIAFPEQAAFPSRGRILAFNSRNDGRRTILAHVYGTKPAPISRLITFHLRRGSGAYGTVLSGDLPESLIHWGFLRRISLSLHRIFTYRGQVRSYLSAACNAPPGFRSATFPFAHASMTFADGRTLSSTLTRSCRVR